MNRLIIQAPEGVEFAVTLAGPGSRLLALIVDLCAVSAGASVLSRALGVVGLLNADLGEALIALAYFAVTVLYGMAAEWAWHGQTVGKRLMGLRVIDATGGRLQPSQIVIRNLIRPVDALPVFYLVGACACLASRHFQRLGDLAGGTVVVRNEALAPPDLEPVLGARFNSMLEYRHLAAQLRQRTPPDLAALALTALLRRDQFDPDARLAVFAALSARLRELVNFPSPAVEDLSSEHYVRNAVEIIFRPTGRRANQANKVRVRSGAG
jgi:uncharacterized RDD family membrane protein YckC